MEIDYNKVRYEVIHDYGSYSHSDILDEFNSLEEAKDFFCECITSPDEWDDCFTIQLNNLNEDGELIDEEYDEIEYLDTYTINEYDEVCK